MDCALLCGSLGVCSRQCMLSLRSAFCTCLRCSVTQCQAHRTSLGGVWLRFREDELETQNVSGGLCFRLFVYLRVTQNTWSKLEGCLELGRATLAVMASPHKHVSWKTGLQIWEWGVSVGFWHSLCCLWNRISDRPSHSPCHSCLPSFFCSSLERGWRN